MLIFDFLFSDMILIYRAYNNDSKDKSLRDVQMQCERLLNALFTVRTGRSKERKAVNDERSVSER